MPAGDYSPYCHVCHMNHYRSPLGGCPYHNFTRSYFSYSIPPTADAKDAEITALRAQVERLKADLERERMRLVACGVVALANTAETAAKAREMSPEYWSASCGDVARAVDREMDLRARLAASKETVRGLRRDIADAYGWLWCVNEEPGTPNRFPAERAAYNARRLLRDLLTSEERGAGINKAVTQREIASALLTGAAAGEGEG